MPPTSLLRTNQSLGILPPVVYKRRICNHLYLLSLFFFSYFLRGLLFWTIQIYASTLACPSLRTSIYTTAFFRSDTFKGFWIMVVYLLIYDIFLSMFERLFLLQNFISKYFLVHVLNYLGMAKYFPSPYLGLFSCFSFRPQFGLLSSVLHACLSFSIVFG